MHTLENVSLFVGVVVLLFVIVVVVDKIANKFGKAIPFVSGTKQTLIKLLS